MNIKDRCINDNLEATSLISDFDYYIAQTGEFVVSSPTYTQDLQNCVVSWFLVSIKDGTETPLSATQLQFVELLIDGSIIINVGNDYSVLDENWDLRLKAISFKSATQSTI